MRKLLATVFVAFALMAAPAAHAQEGPADMFPQDEFMLGRVDAVVERTEIDMGGYSQPLQRTRIEVTSGPEKGKLVEVEHAGVYNDVEAGDAVIVTKVTVEGETKYYLEDEFRLPALGIILTGFFLIAALFAGKRGVTAVLGLAFSVSVLALYVVPKIASGQDPIRVTLFGAVAIMLVALFLAHGWNYRTGIALASTTVTLAISAVLATLFVDASRLLGLGSDAAAALQLGPLGVEKMRGLLLGGIIIGTLGVLDDVTTAQTAVIEQLAATDPGLGVRTLYRRGIAVGREHIASLVNTLALAYAGASLPLFLLFTLDRAQPFWVLLNGESVAEEIVRTLVGSTALVFAVPISTWLAAYLYGTKRVRPEPHDDGPAHHHAH